MLAFPSALHTLLLFVSCQYAVVNSFCLFGCNDQFLPPFNPTALQSAAGRWWKGPNVCNINDNDETTESAVDMNGPFHMNIWASNSFDHANHRYVSRSCRDYSNAYVCITKSVSNGTRTVTKSGYRCCSGFERLPGGYGCQKESPVTDLLDTLNRLNLTALASAFEKSKAHEVFAGKRVTLFAPTNAALSDNPSDSNGIFNVVVFETGDELQPVRDILLNGVAEGELNTWDLVSKGRVKTLRDDGELIIDASSQCCGQEFQVNCAAVKRPDVAFNGGVIHVVDAFIQPAAKSVLDLLESNPDYSKFLSLTSAETKQQLKDPESHVTVFAFTNKAYDSLPLETQTAIDGGHQCYKHLLDHHILNEALCRSDLEHRSRMNSVVDIFHQVFRDDSLLSQAKKKLRIFKNGDGQIVVENATVVGDNRVAQNGVVHTISSVLLSPKMQSPMQNLANVAPKMQTMLKDSDLIQSGVDSSYSILVPPTKTVNEIESDTDVDRRKNLLARYLIKGELGSTKSEVTTVGGEQLLFKPARQSLWMSERPDIIGSLNCIAVLSHKIPSCGGTIYQLAKPLPSNEESVMQYLRKNSKFSQFVMLAEAAGFADVLSNAGETVTVMAFTDEAFDKAFDAKAKDAMMKDQSRLKEFIGTHIVQGYHCCVDMVNTPFSFFDFQDYKTLAGTQKTIFGSKECCLSYGHNNAVTCNLATTKNGVVHQLAKPDVKSPRPSVWSSFMSPWGDGNFFSF